jgi:glycosyltransferase involved in cell wall biosynthesis
MLSVIIPTFNEIKSGYIQKIFPLLKNTKDIEVLCIDSNSTDGTREFIQEYGFKLITTDTTSRAKRLNLGMENAQGEMLLLHHPRSLLSVNAIATLKNEKDLYWGVFTHRFDHVHPLLKFTSWWSNNVRGDLRKVFYLDHCFFVRKEVIDEVGYMPEVDIFEDTELSLMLKSYCDPIRLDDISLTSAIRFKKNGVWKQAIHNQILKWKYYFKFNNKVMNKAYEKNTSLNSSYKKNDS